MIPNDDLIISSPKAGWMDGWMDGQTDKWKVFG